MFIIIQYSQIKQSFKGASGQPLRLCVGFPWHISSNGQERGKKKKKKKVWCGQKKRKK